MTIIVLYNWERLCIFVRYDLRLKNQLIIKHR